MVLHRGEADAVRKLPVLVAAATEKVQTRGVESRTGGKNAKLGIAANCILEHHKFLPLFGCMESVPLIRRGRIRWLQRTLLSGATTRLPACGWNPPSPAER